MSSAAAKHPPLPPQAPGSGGIVVPPLSLPSSTQGPQSFPLLFSAQAHDSEILCLDYAHVNGAGVQGSVHAEGGSKDDAFLLASASRDYVQ